MTSPRASPRPSPPSCPCPEPYLQWAAGGSTNVSVLPSQRERAARNARHTRVLSAAAAAVLVLGAVVLGTQFFQDDTLSSDTAGGAGADQGAAAPEAAEATLFTTSGASYSAADIDTKATGLVETASVAGAPLKAWSETPASSDPSPVATPLRRDSAGRRRR